MRVYRPGEGRLPGLLYLHGGGWVAGSVDTHDGVCAALAAEANAVVASVQYRRAPESPCPAPNDDAFAAAPHLDLHIQACPSFVDYVEQGVTGGDELLAAAHEYLDPLAAAGVDTLILGCTHYPLLTGVISYVMGEQVTLVSSAEETAKDVYRTLVRRGLERDPVSELVPR